MEVVWTAPALADLEAIQDFIAVESPAAAHKLASSIVERVERLLSETPNSGRTGRFKGTREFYVSRTPYVAVYRTGTRVEVDRSSRA